MEHVRQVATYARLRHVPEAAIQLGSAVELNQWTDARDLPAQRKTEGGKFKLQMPELPRAGDQRIELRPGTMMVERQFAHWSTTPSQPDSYSLLNTAFNDLLNALGIYSSEGSKLLTEDQGRYVGATHERGALATFVLNLGEVSAPGLHYHPDQIVYVDYAI